MTEHKQQSFGVALHRRLFFAQQHDSSNVSTTSSTGTQQQAGGSGTSSIHNEKTIQSTRHEREKSMELPLTVPTMTTTTTSRRGTQRLKRSKSGDDQSPTDNEWSAAQINFETQFLAGLTIAGVGSALLSTVYGLFYVDVFLHVYELPLITYATGNLIFSVINTANDLGGAWLVDWMAIHSSRADAIGLAGCLFAICFLTPFFRWNIDTSVEDRTHFEEGIHFVTTTSLYDTMYSFFAILLGSVVTDDHTMSDRDRVRFMASGKVVNLLATFAVARIGLEVFEKENISKFRVFVLILSTIVCFMFIVAQYMVIRPGRGFNWKTLGYRRKHSDHNSTADSRKLKQKKLKLWRVIAELWSLDNFRAWIGMEMLLECQSNFVGSFLKTFVDRLVFDAGVSRDTCDWLLSSIRPLRDVAGILCYIPIRQRGYRKVYTAMFVLNFTLSGFCLLFGSPSSTTMIISFMVIHSVATGAVLSAGFHLAMSDMVLEMKTKHASEQRFDEPSLAGMFMGANALLCKPMDALLPFVAASFLGDYDFSAAESSDGTRLVLFRLLVVPPLVFSIVQIWSWRRYNLHPERTKVMREKLDSLHNSVNPLEEDVP